MKQESNMNNLHISLTEFRNESRVLKETQSLVNNKVFSKVFIAALHDKGLEELQYYTEYIQAKRFKLKTRSLNKTFLMQGIKYFEFCFKVFLNYRKKNITTVNIHALGVLPLGFFLKYAYKAKLIYDTHELETESNGLIGFRKNISKWLERKLIKHVNMTIVVSESIADWYTNEYNLIRPPVVLNAPNKREHKKNNYFREQLNIRKDQLILLYQGGLMTGRGVHLILDAFKQRKDDKVVVVFMGYGELDKDIKQASELHTNIYFYPAVAPDIVLDYTSSADIGISLIENTCLSYYYCMPNKLFEYAMAGLPVIVSNMKDMSELVIKNNMGTVISDFSPEGINKAVDDFLLKDLSEMKDNAYRVACENSWEEQEKKMLDAYKEILNKVD